MDKFWVVTIMAFYTLVIVFGIHSYEEKLKKYKKQSNYWHDLVHTLNNLSGEKTKEYLKIQQNMNELDQDNHILKARINALQQELVSLRNREPIQYESSGWISSLPSESAPTGLPKMRKKGMGFVRLDESIEDAFDQEK